MVVAVTGRAVKEGLPEERAITDLSEQGDKKFLAGGRAPAESGGSLPGALELSLSSWGLFIFFKIIPDSSHEWFWFCEIPFVIYHLGRKTEILKNMYDNLLIINSLYVNM